MMNPGPASNYDVRVRDMPYYSPVLIAGRWPDTHLQASSKIRAGIAAPSIASNKVRAGFTPSMASDKNRAEIAARRKEELASLQKDQEAKVREAVSERDRKTSELCVQSGYDVQLCQCWIMCHLRLRLASCIVNVCILCFVLVWSALAWV